DGIRDATVTGVQTCALPIYVVRLAVAADADRRDDGNEAVLLEQADRLGVDDLDLAHQADVDLLAARHPVRPAARAQQVGILAGEANRPPAVMVDEADDLLVDLADQDHLDDLDGLLVGHPHAAHEAWLLAEALHQRADLGPAPVHDDRMNANEVEENHVEREARLEVGLFHRGAAVLDDDRL